MLFIQRLILGGAGGERAKSPHIMRKVYWNHHIEIIARFLACSKV